MLATAVENKELKDITTSCSICFKTDFVEVLDLGLTPIAHRYLKATEKDKLKLEYKNRLAIKMCCHCSFIQLIDPIPAEELYRNYNFCFSSWKPQPHMWDEIDLIKRTTGLSATIVEIGSNDGSFLKLLNQSGFKSLIGIEPNFSSAELTKQSDIVIIQSYFDKQCTQQILAQFGQVEMVVARQCIEHIADLKTLMNNVNQLIKPNGWLMLEVPDFEVPLTYGDCSQLWEEHVNYFTEPVLRAFLSTYSYGVQIVKRYPFSGGALMVLAQRKNLEKFTFTLTTEIGRIKELAFSYQAKVNQFQEKLIYLLKQAHEKGEKNILYGSGCRANAIINGLKLEKYFDLIVDDQPEKMGLLMPGCGLQIVSSQSLYENIGNCFLCVNTENEHKVIQKHPKYLELGGRFYSLNSPSNIYLNN